ncbi:bacteriohemerythrin [Geomonas ferrireducens]|uniref:bacteriohemerythrin n=1 Tax=Geomonas ferrireducens TaxID=2570227 RepID=UPI0013A5EC46|nr:hemerythrin domain-containing protein [Geomonas ferrireducens]
MFNTKWTPDLVIGIDDVDQCHQYIVRMINDAYDGFVVGINPESYILDEILVCMSQCFDYEQMLMMENCYPDFLAHRDEHELFRQRMIDVHSRRNKEGNLTIDLLVILDHWVNRHIRECDAKLGEYVAEFSAPEGMCRTA